MIQNDLSWQSKDGLTIFAHTWQPALAPKAVITLVHGFGEHCLRYTPYFEFFVSAGFAVVGFDLRGHGQSGGKRGAITSYDYFLDDVELAINKTHELYPSLPHYIYGHSMGGNIALNFLLRRPTNLTGGIITSPWLELTKEPNLLLKGLLAILKAIAPNLTIESGLKSGDISRSKAEVNLYESDPLNHGRISFRLLSEISNSGKWAINNAGKLQTRVLLMHGTADKITSVAASRKAAANTHLMQLLEWQGGYHELHNEPNRAEVANAVIKWISDKL